MPDHLESYSEEELRKLLMQMDALSSKPISSEKPKTDDELHAWIQASFGVYIPRVAVCPGHNAPFEFIADLFFGREDAALVVGSRGSGKSYLAALWSVINSYWEPGVECLHVGAIEIQAKRVYSHVKQFQAKAAPEKIASTTISETLWNTGSKTEIVTGSLSSVNGPHSQKVHRDEVELMDRNVYQEALPLNEPVLTPSGFIKNGELQEGDYVIGQNGKATKVLSIFDFPFKKPILEIEFADGRTVRCTDDHLWQVTRAKSNSEYYWHIIRAKDILESKLRNKQGPMYYVPSVEPVEYPTREFVISPYSMGALLGDGHFGTDRIGFASNGEVAPLLEKELPESLSLVCYEENKSYGISGQGKNIFLEESRKLNLAGKNAKDKFIPEKYLLGDIKQRVSLLQGLMDTDGFIHSKGTCSFATVSEKLAKDFASLIYSLGGTARISKREYKKNDINKNWNSLYQVHFSLPENIIPFRLKRKQDRKKTPRKNICNQSIKSIKKIGEDYSRCIIVENDDQLYVTNQYIVTHNSLMIERAKNIEGKEIKAQTLLTSTRKTSDGLMQELLDECNEAIKQGRKPPYKVYVMCIKECISNQPHCQVAKPDASDHLKCNCDEVRSGEWEENQPRTFDQVCGGALFKADGFIPLDDAHKTFEKSSKAIWEAQQECKRPYVEDISLPEFSREKHGIRGFELDPENGPIYQGIDWGGSSPFAVEWFQVLDYEIEVESFSGLPKRLKEGTRVLFYELYIAEIGNTELADLIVEIEKEYRRQHPKFRVRGRFADPQGKAAKLDLKRHDPPLICSWPTVTRDREEHFKRLRSAIVDGLFVFDLDKVEMFPEEIEAWNINLRRKKFDHAVDAVSYALSNIHVLENKRSKSTIELPGIDSHRHLRGTPTPFNENLPTSMPSPLARSTLTEKDKWA